ncbi:MAG TPA: glycogen debranching protein, partial [Chloroflexota bacterium]
RALRELETLFAAQWSDGRVPHIVFNPQAADYFPGPEWWASAQTNPHAPRGMATSGLIQPPVHALALKRIHNLAGDRLGDRIGALYEQVLAWHRYLARARDPHGSGLLVIYHPWESGTDNSPRWDAALANLDVGELPAYQRHDLQHVEDPSERPTHSEYDRYLWLVELLKRAGYDDPTIQSDYPFQIRDVLLSGIFAAASRALADVARALSRPPAEIAEVEAMGERSSRAVQDAWDPELRVALDYDVGLGAPVRVETCAGLAPLLVPGLSPALLAEVVARLEGPGFAGTQGLAFAVVPSTVPGSPGYQSRSYWRGPCWPVANWLFWWALREQHEMAAAARLRAANLALLEQPAARFAEYFEPFSGEPLGSLDQSWTAAVALDWLAEKDGWHAETS